MLPRGHALGGPSGLLLAGILVFALNLRAPIAALPPVVADVATDLGLTQAGAGLLTGVPVLCFALLTPAASALLARLGPGSAVTVSLVTVLVGTIVRSSGGFGTALAGTILIGAAITVGNVSVPVIVSRDFQSSASTVTGLYTAALNTGSVLTTTFTAPLAAEFGWRWALVSWSGLAVVALVLWRFAAPHLRRTERLVHTGEDAPGDAHVTPGVLRRPFTWLLAAAFAGQAFSYYAVTAWLPSLLGDELGLPRTAAGGAASLFQLLAIVGAIAVPVTLSRRVPVRAVALAITVCWMALPLGLLLAPELWVLWCSLAGAAQGGNFAVIFTLVAVRAGSTRDARRMSAAVQTTGYAFAALGPSVLGAVHTATGGWDAPLLVVLGSLLVMGGSLAVASR